ncbi:MAG: beta-L-arabinofuranosidase domain-containing protein [Thermoguttaceae bacterium]
MSRFTMTIVCLVLLGSQGFGDNKFPTRLKASDPATWKPAVCKAVVPAGGVTLDDAGLFKPVMENNIEYLLKSFSVNHMLVPFRQRAGRKDPPDDKPQVKFWDTDLRGSSAGRFMMGAGNTLRWIEHPELRKRLDELIDGIEACRGPNGYILAYPPDKVRSEEPNYGRAWFTHGLIEAAIAGNPKAYGLLRGHADWFNQWDMLPKLLYHDHNSHQGHIASTRTYFTPIGKPEDLQTAEKYYVCDWWMDQLAAHQEEAVWKYPLQNPHSYLITSFEAYLDHYLATGDRKYLEAMVGAWDLIHDKWEHVGGSMAICEGKPNYPPGSYYITTKGHTGETCGSVFWIKFNQRFHRFYPEDEKYVGEIEKSIYNVCLANQVGSQGIRYHARLEGRKEAPTVQNTCCEGQGTRFFGSLPEYIYSLAEDGLYVNLYEPSAIRWPLAGQPLSLTMKTSFPFQPEVSMKLATEKPAKMKLRVRVPSWAAGDVPISVNGRQTMVGKPGSYAVLDRTWTDGDTVTFSLPMGFRVTRYTGADQIAGHQRYAFEFGPVLLAVVGPPGQIAHDPARPQDWLKPRPDRPLHFDIAGDSEHRFMPYWQVTNETYTCFPVVELAAKP